jgi:hypothetical protein
MFLPLASARNLVSSIVTAVTAVHALAASDMELTNATAITAATAVKDAFNAAVLACAPPAEAPGVTTANDGALFPLRRLIRAVCAVGALASDTDEVVAFNTLDDIPSILASVRGGAPPACKHRLALLASLAQPVPVVSILNYGDALSSALEFVKNSGAELTPLFMVSLARLYPTLANALKGEAGKGVPSWLPPIASHLVSLAAAHARRMFNSAGAPHPVLPGGAYYQNANPAEREFCRPVRCSRTACVHAWPLPARLAHASVCSILCSSSRLQTSGDCQ